MKPASRDQTHEILGRLIRNTKWGELDGEALQQADGAIGMSEEQFGKNFTLFLKNGGRLVIKGPSVLIVDRTKPFNPTAFVGNGWTIWCGPKDGNGLTGEEEQDARLLKHTEIDFAKVLFEHCLKKSEPSITGEEKLVRHMAAKHTRLDAKVGQCLLEEKGQATLEWLYQTFGITWFELPGTVLRYADGDRYFLCLCRDDNGRWYWNDYWLGSCRRAKAPSALLAS